MNQNSLNVVNSKIPLGLNLVPLQPVKSTSDLKPSLEVGPPYPPTPFTHDPQNTGKQPDFGANIFTPSSYSSNILTANRFNAQSANHYVPTNQIHPLTSSFGNIPFKVIENNINKVNLFIFDF